MLAEAQAVDHQRAHATRWLQGTDQRIEERRGKAMGHPEG